MSSFVRKIIDSMLPKGIVWTVAAESDLDKYLDAQADNYDPIIVFLRQLASFRDPEKTTLLDELEREFGISKNDNLTEAQRRAFLEAFAFPTENGGTGEEMEEKLVAAGFSVQVHRNDPAQDPQVILDQTFRMVAGGFNAFAGRVDAFARREGGELIVNGDKFQEIPRFLAIANGPTAFAGNAAMVAGRFDELVSTKIEYPVPTNPADFPFIFFIGGDATVDGNGKILAIESVIQPKELRNEFLDIILKYKPLHTWVVSVVDFI